MSLEELDIVQSEQFSYSIHKRSIVLPKNNDNEIDIESFNDSLRNKFLNLMVYSSVHKSYIISYNFQLFIVKSQDLNELYKSTERSSVGDGDEESEVINGTIVDDENILLMKLIKYSIDSAINITQLCLSSDDQTLIISDTNNNIYTVHLERIMNNGEIDFQLLIKSDQLDSQIRNLVASPHFANEFWVLLLNGDLHKVETTTSKTQLFNEHFYNGKVTALTFHNDNLLVCLKDSRKIAQMDKHGSIIELSFVIPSTSEIQDNEFPVHIDSISHDKVLLVYSNQIEPEDQDNADQEPIEFRNFLISTSNNNVYKIEELCPPWGSIPRNLFYYSASLRDWSLVNPDLLIITTSQSLEIGSLTPDFQLAPLNDSDRAQFPMDEITNADDTPLGLALDLYSDLPLLQPTEDIESYEPAPRVACLTNQGKLIIWDLIDLQGISGNKLSLEKARNYISSQITSSTSTSIDTSTKADAETKHTSVINNDDDFFSSMSLTDSKSNTQANPLSLSSFKLDEGDDEETPKTVSGSTTSNPFGVSTAGAFGSKEEDDKMSIFTSKKSGLDDSTPTPVFKEPETFSFNIGDKSEAVSNPFGSSTSGVFGDIKVDSTTANSGFGSSASTGFSFGGSKPFSVSDKAIESPFAALAKPQEPETAAPEPVSNVFKNTESSVSPFAAYQHQDDKPSQFGQAGFGGGAGAFKFGNFGNSLANQIAQNSQKNQESQVAPQATNSPFGGFAAKATSGFSALNQSSTNSIFSTGASSGNGFASFTQSSTGSIFDKPKDNQNAFGQTSSNVFGAFGSQNAFGSFNTSTQINSDLDDKIEEYVDDDNDYSSPVENEEESGGSEDMSDYEEEESDGGSDEENQDMESTQYKGLFDRATSLPLQTSDIADEPIQYNSSPAEDSEERNESNEISSPESEGVETEGMKSSDVEEQEPSIVEESKSSIAEEQVEKTKTVDNEAPAESIEASVSDMSDEFEDNDVKAKDKDSVGGLESEVEAVNDENIEAEPEPEASKEKKPEVEQETESSKEEKSENEPDTEATKEEKSEAEAEPETEVKDEIPDHADNEVSEKLDRAIKHDDDRDEKTEESSSESKSEAEETSAETEKTSDKSVKVMAVTNVKVAIETRGLAVDDGAEASVTQAESSAGIEPVYEEKMASTLPLVEEQVLAFGDEEDEIYLSKLNIPKAVPDILALDKVIYPQLDETPLIAEVEKMVYDFEAQIEIVKMNMMAMHAFISDETNTSNVKHTSASFIYPQFWKLSEAKTISESLETLKVNLKSVSDGSSQQKEKVMNVAADVTSAISLTVEIKEQLLRPQQAKEKAKSAKSSSLTFQQIQQRDKLRKGLLQIDRLEKELNSKLLILNGLAFPEKIVGDSRNLQRVIAGIDTKIRVEFENLKKLKDEVAKLDTSHSPKKALIHSSSPVSSAPPSSSVNSSFASFNRSYTKKTEEKIRFVEMNETVAKQKYIGSFLKTKKLNPSYLN